jgi:hypothetical protein
MYRVILAGAALGLVADATPLRAQRWQIDASGTRVEFDTLAAAASGSLIPAIEVQRRSAYAFVSGGLTAFDGGEWSLQGRGDLSLLVEPFGRFAAARVELVAMAAGTHHSSDFRTAGTRGEARLHVGGRQLGGWVGVAGGTGWTSADERLVTGVGPTAGIWGRYATARAAVIFAPLRIEQQWFPELTGRLSATAGAVDVGAYGGWRGAPEASLVESASWAGVSATWWVAPPVGLTLSGGSYASELLQGLPSGRFVSAGLRITHSRPLVLSIKPLGRPAYERENGAGTLRFRVPDAARVAIAGQWNNWQPVPMERAAGDRWTLRVALPTGVYRFNLVVDGETWIVPDGVPSVDDGYGGRVGLLIVP